MGLAGDRTVAFVGHRQFACGARSKESPRGSIIIPALARAGCKQRKGHHRRWLASNVRGLPI